MTSQQRDLFTLWDVVQRKLQTSLRANPQPGWSFDNVSWPEIPLALAERGFFLQGLPSICKPEVRKDEVQDDLISWSMDQLLSLERVIDDGSLTVAQREPLSRRVIIEIIEPNGTPHDSTLGFSDQWIFEHMFPERLYEQYTVPVLKAMNVDSFVAVLEKGKINHTGVPWIVLPSKLWGSGQFLSGMPRNCLPKVVEDKVEADDPSPATKWRKDQRVSFQRSADSGLLKVLPRPPDRNVIFEVLESDGLLRDEDCGFSMHWRMKFPPYPDSKGKIHQRNKSVPGPSNAMQAVTPFIWQQLNQVNKPPPQPILSSKKSIVAERYAALLRIHGLLLESPDGPAWVYVPQMLATRRCFILGLPRDCLPIVRDDDVVANYDPRQWSSAAQDSFLQVTDANKLVVISNTSRVRVLYRVVEQPGSTTDETIGFSEKWLRDNLVPIDLADPSVSPSMFVQELWLCMLESVNIPCHDHRGRRRIPWLQLPTFLGHRRGYIAGCPMECHPKVEEDTVSEMSSPYFWNDRQIRLMAEAFIRNSVSVCSRQPNRNVIFTHMVNGNTIDSTCGFSPRWVEMNLHAVPNSISNPLPINGLGPFVPAVTGPPPPPPSEPPAQSEISRPQKITVKRYAKRPRDPIALLAGSSVSPTFNSIPALHSTPMAHAAPIIHGTSTVRITSAVNALPPIAPAPTINNQSSSLKIIIPAFKRRNILAQKEAEAAGRPLSRPTTQVSGPSVPMMRPKRHSQPIPALPRHMVPSKRLSLRSSGPVTPAYDPLPLRHHHPAAESSATSEDDKPAAWGLRSSMSPPLPPSSTLPNPLPNTPVPGFLPVPGGGLTWDDQRNIWELTVSEMYPPEEWKQKLPVFPARVLWNAMQQVWMCEPSRSLTKPLNRSSLAVQVALESSTIEGPVPSVEPGLSIIWHRWRRTWGLFEYMSPIAT